uniref:RING-type domain-containing protein n=1 Tax=Caenorhabditis tropicalis TaxID=1561998 RepID=A0A1I7TKB7_9PELO
MELVPKSYLTVESIRSVKFNLKPSCTICMEAFDTNVRIPKVLGCGHSFCIKCIEGVLKSMQISHSGEGEVFTSFACPICRSATPIPNNGISGFSTNHQLIDAIAPQDTRFILCTSCNTNGCETAFHVCRQCTISKHKFDIKTILEDEPPVHPDNLVVCSTCILKNHNTPEHKVFDYLPIRLHYQFQRNQKSVDVLRSQMVEKFADVRDILKMLPLVVEKKEAEVDKLLDLMQRAKCRQSQDVIFEKYKQEMNDIIKILVMVKKMVVL